MKNIAKADRPKSAIAILPPRPFRGSGKVAQTAFKSARRDGKSFTHMANHVFNDLGIPKISPTATFRIAAIWPDGLTMPRGKQTICYLARVKMMIHETGTASGALATR